MENLKDLTREQLNDLVEEKLQDLKNLTDRIEKETEYEVSNLIVTAIHERDLRKAKDLSSINLINGRPQMLLISLMDNNEITNFVKAASEIIEEQKSENTEE
ncbi:DUF2482 family protein [Staphylococcus hominis]|uniref:DUF2482 family protein n=1 Tax=Staphylococcus hominis TaxID=1290 RepID=UPI000D1E232B|nr:DUF2482 family protein [Staphylococcus hominis]PTK37695.1 hypothetical protein BUZ45_03070 [Staphylococcus hominis]